MRDLAELHESNSQAGADPGAGPSSYRRLDARLLNVELAELLVEANPMPGPSRRGSQVP